MRINQGGTLNDFLYRELMNMVRARIIYVRENLTQEATSPNIMRHFLKIVRELYESASKVK